MHNDKLGFDFRTGIANTGGAQVITFQKIRRSCCNLEEFLLRLNEKFNPYGIQVTWDGVGGSFANGEPRVGLWPKYISYEAAKTRQSEHPRRFPSDLDLESNTKYYHR